MRANCGYCGDRYGNDGRCPNCGLKYGEPPRRYVSLGPGYCGDYDQLDEAQASVARGGGGGAVYIRMDVLSKMHFGDPCIYCGQAWGQVAVGDCPGPGSPAAGGGGLATQYERSRTMGPYCNFCNQRCFVPFPEDTPDEAINAYRAGVSIIATCPEGQTYEKKMTGWCYDDIMAGIRMMTYDDTTTPPCPP